VKEGDDGELFRVIDQAKLIAGSFRRDPLQLVLIVMFAGVIIVGIWHGMAVDRQTKAILEVTEVIRNARK
jgi:hypothetical protein